MSTFRISAFPTFRISITGHRQKHLENNNPGLLRDIPGLLSNNLALIRYFLEFDDKKEKSLCSSK